MDDTEKWDKYQNILRSGQQASVFQSTVDQL